ncbi:hypothetical protein WMF18_19585 [Sorangium sp. So ce315]|uniref:hypothetical protein n=1 Tax=Sorangium sp. So ce315 TaxID=3133299 RepID=UPI003F5FBDE5
MGGGLRADAAPSGGQLGALPVERDDAELLGRLRRGDPWATAVLFVRYGVVVERIARRILGTERHTTFADVVHDAFVSTYDRRGGASASAAKSRARAAASASAGLRLAAVLGALPGLLGAAPPPAAAGAPATPPARPRGPRRRPPATRRTRRSSGSATSSARSTCASPRAAPGTSTRASARRASRGRRCSGVGGQMNTTTISYLRFRSGGESMPRPAIEGSRAR